MTTRADPVDAIVVGAGPNGLAAAITLARAGRSVRVYEAASTAGGGTRTAELTLPGFRHDVCSTILPLTIGSPFFATIDLAARGVELIQPDAPFAHPLDGGRAAVLERSVRATADGLGGADGRAWRRLFGPLVREIAELGPEILRPVVHVPRHPLALARFGLPALRSADGLARGRFRGAGSPGAVRRGGGPLDAPSRSPVDGVVRARPGHLRPCRRLADGPRRVGRDRAGPGGRARRPPVASSSPATGSARSPSCRRRARSCSTSRPASWWPSPAIGCRPASRRRAERFRYGSGVFKMDWALDGPVPWAAEGPRRAATVHLGGTLEEIAAAEAEVAAGRHADRPYVLFVQYAPWDPTRAPDGKTTAWAYCHVPAGSEVDMTDRIEAQVERFAPGFRDRILARSTIGPAAMEAYDANYVGGDINGGIQDIRQLVFRPWPTRDPYRVGDGLYLCSSSTPPGGGVHGMSGALAARSALRHELR